MTNRRAVMLLVPLVAASVAVSGCSFFSRSKSRIFSLERMPGAAATMTTTAAPTGTTPVARPIGIDAIELPPGLDRKEIVVRQANHQLDVRGTEQWSAPLQEMVLHTLASDLADRMPNGMVVLPGQAKPASAMRAIDVAFEELAAGPEPRVVVDVRWVVRESGRPDVAHREQFDVPLPSLDSPNIATGMSTALATLADRMAAQLR